MMINRQSGKIEPAGFLLICLILLALAAKRHETSFVTKAEEADEKAVVIQIRGDVPFKGTYIFDRPPGDAEWLPGFLKQFYPQDARTQSELPNGTRTLIEITKTNKGWAIVRKGIPAYQKLTLGIPLSLNRETEEGLTAIPGIGPQAAKILITERRKRGGFKNINELKSVKGIGPAIFQKIKPFLSL